MWSDDILESLYKLRIRGLIKSKLHHNCTIWKSKDIDTQLSEIDNDDEEK